MKALIIVESPTKIKTLKKFLGTDYSFESSVGHIRDLPEKEFGIDVEHDFSPQYINMPDKAAVIKKLKDAAKKADIVYLSPDPDREGEAIAWHIASILPKSTKMQRITFHSITKSAVQEALKHPREIDLNLVNAQQVRRILDRMVGYKISPILNKKIRRKSRDGISAGRVQSVALKLVVEREKEIEKFVPVEYWNLSSVLSSSKKDSSFPAHLLMVDGKKVEKEGSDKKDIFTISTKDAAEDILKRLQSAKYVVDCVERKEKKRNPVPPFITSTLQQEASRHYGFAVSRTMSIAQSLYEGVDLGPLGTEGLITYMRTDSVQVAPEAITAARSLIKGDFGAEFLPEKPNFYTSKKSAQEAHEAIRPTNMNHAPEDIKAYLSPEQFKLYLLIWRRFIASQMNPAVYDTISADIQTDNNMKLRATGSLIKFPGFLKVYEEKTDIESADEDKMPLPPLTEGQALILQDVKAEQAFTKPPFRFTEASLVKELEKSGIGRPSTYASIMNKIQRREYTVKERQTLRPTELGMLLVQMLEDNFAPIMDINFTSAMEDDLELVAEGKVEWKNLLKDFWGAFFPMVEKAAKDAMVPRLATDQKCPKCGSPLEKIWSKGKFFYGCSKYPDCDFTSAIEALKFNKEDYAEDFNWEQPCPKCGEKMVVRWGRFGPFLGCSGYPKCTGLVNIPKKGEAPEEEGIPCPAIGCEGKIRKRTSRYGKPFYSCSEFPNCDVIANSLEQLESKYGKTHPKTAYVKRPKGAGGSNRSYNVTPEFEAIIGSITATRKDALKGIWAYIKEHNLQDPANKRKIIPDEKLAKVFGTKEPVDMMQIAKVIGKHLVNGKK